MSGGQDCIAVEFERQDAIEAKRPKSHQGFRFGMNGDPPIGESYFDEWPIPPIISETDRRMARLLAESSADMIGGDGYAIAIHRDRLFRLLCNLIVSLRGIPMTTATTAQAHAEALAAALEAVLPGALIGDRYDPPVPDNELLREFYFTWGKLRSARSALTAYRKDFPKPTPAKEPT